MTLKRINYFKGLFLHAQDLQDAEKYRDEKSRLHNLCLHRPGIVYGYQGDLMVRVGQQGKSILVDQGMAIDHQGRDIYLTESEEIAVLPAGYDSSTILYVTLRRKERFVDHRRNVPNKVGDEEFSGYAFIEERAVVEATTEQPANDAIELARVRLSGRKAQIAAPSKATEPGDDELDLRYRMRAGLARGFLSLQDYAVLACEATSHVEGRGSAQIRIEEIPVSADNHHRFYVVSARPLGEAQITWRLESSVDRRGTTEYTLRLENLSDTAVDIDCQVYSFA